VTSLSDVNNAETKRNLATLQPAEKSVAHKISTYVPSLYVLNAAALSKPGAVEQLTTDLSNCGSDMAVITETHLSLNMQTVPLWSTATQYSGEIVLVDEAVEWLSTVSSTARTIVPLN